MQEPYLEDQDIIIPNIIDGPTTIGDLWDCQKSRLIGFNLFGKKLDSQHLEANVIKELKYTLTHVRNITDRHKSLQVSGELALEILGGLIKVGGGAEYDSDEQTHTLEEELLCHYDLKTFSVKALPAAKEVMDHLVTEKILKGEIKATHVVGTTILGAEVMASIRISEAKSNTKEDIKGDFFGKLIVGPISASAKVALGKLDDNKSQNFEKKIKVDSKPFFNSQPESVSDMFKFIEGIGKMVEEEKHQAYVNIKDADIFGVPLRFYMVPIKHFLDFPVERLYLQIKDDLLEKFIAVLTTLTDVQIRGYLKKRILEGDPRLKKILLDQNNPLAMKISQRENEIRALAKQHYANSVETLKGYKMRKFDQEHLLKLANSIDNEINITLVLNEIQRFINDGRKELQGIHDGDIEDTHQLKIFTSSMDMKEWYQTQKPIKVLLRTGGNCVNNGHVTRLYEINRFLKDIGVEVGIATPIISDGHHNLSIKIHGSDVTYPEEDITFVIKILLLLVNQADQTTTRLFTLYAFLNGIMLPLQQHLNDLHSMIKILSDIKHIKVGDSLLKLRDFVLERDGRWKFVMDLNAFDSAAETVDMFKCQKIQLSEVAGDWMVGNYGIESATEYSNAPLLFIFKDEKLQAVCLDNVDILLLIEAFKSNRDNFFKLLYPDLTTMEKSCLNRARADFALKALQFFQSKHSILEDDPRVSKTGAFSSIINKNIEALQVLVRSFIGNDDIRLWGAMANIMVNDFPDVKIILKSYTWIEEVNGYPAGFKNVNPLHLATALKDYFIKQDPFYAKVQVVLESVSCIQSSTKIKPEAVEECINNLTSDKSCPEQLKNHLVACEEIQDNLTRFEKVEKILKMHLKTVEVSKYETVSLFIELLEVSSEKLQDFFGKELLPKLAARLNVDDSKYSDFHAKLLNVVGTRNYYMVLHVLAKIQYVEHHLFLVSNQLEALTGITDTRPLCLLLGKDAVDTLSINHYHWLFANPKFVSLLKTNSDCSELLQTIKVFHCLKSKIANYIPDFLKKSLQTIMAEDDLVECPDVIKNTDHAIAVFQAIIAQNCVPDNFGKVLGYSVTKSLEFKTDLGMANALFYWSEERELFEEIWDIETIKMACNHLIEWKKCLAHKQADKNVITFNIKIHSHKSRNSYSDVENLDQQNDLDGMGETQAWRSLLGPSSETICLRKFLEICSIIAEPCMTSIVDEGYLATLLPYIIQRLKMWGIHIIQQENLAKLHTSLATMPSIRRFKKFEFDTHTSQSPTPLGNSTKPNTHCPIARIDILTCLNAVCHSIVFQDLLRVMSQFPVALPLVLKELHHDHWDYVCLVPLLKSSSVKWETQPGIVIRNQLFTNPFKMIVALRVGSAKPGSSGKSTVLNQVMGTKHMFSSLGGPGADRGIPVTFHGSAELSVLLQETCSYALWESVIKSHYLTGCNEVLMLVNVHGDALELPQTIELLKGMATAFILFFMPCTKLQLQTRSSEIQEMLDDSDDIVYILVDPMPDCESNSTGTINTTQLMLDSTLETVRSAVGAAIDMGRPRTMESLSNVSNKIRPSPKVHSNESEILITYIKNLGCKIAKSILQLQKVNPKYSSNYSAFVITTWKKDSRLENIVTMFVDILNLPVKVRLLAFAHLDRELSLLTANESIQIREKLGKLNEERRILSLEVGSTLSPEQNKIMEQIRRTMDELDGMSLGMEHFYREIGRIYQSAQCSDVPRNESILSLPRRYAELLIYGHALEILDGDIADMCGPWLNSICHSVCESHPELRIFTLSIIGLQSSGKSTLLNALFACQFAVSVGRCTRGLFMRLIFLSKSLVEELNIDAILLIDTEGLGAPEKLNDPEAEHKDRLLATFAMSVSNLTLINVLGESIRDLTDILQIVIVTMARLEIADISPDILMVQHLSERDNSKTMKGADEFCKALQEAVLLTDSKDTALGVRSCKSLRNLESRVKNGQVLKQFRPFKNGASTNAPPSQEYHEDVVDLYETILKSCKHMARPQKFHTWHELIQNYWDAVRTQDFSLRFKNIQEVQEFIDRGIAIAKTKEALDGAFRVHREYGETKLRQMFSELANNPEGLRNWETEKEKELQTIREDLRWIPDSCEPICSKCSTALQLKNQLFRDLKVDSCRHETETTINFCVKRTRESVNKHLSQMAEAIGVKHGYTCYIDDIIGNILKTKLTDETRRSKSQRKKVAYEVWLRVEQQVSQKLQVAPAKRRICVEVSQQYYYISAVSKHFWKETTTIGFPNVECLKAIDFTYTAKAFNAVKDFVSIERQQSFLDYHQACILKSQLDNLPHLLLKEQETDHFENGMVTMLKIWIDQLLIEFEKKHLKGKKLLPEFKWQVHVYAILKFIEMMTLREEEWNRNNNPYYILCQNKATYRKTIYTRLKHGFGFEAEGWIIGDALLKAIRNRGQKQGDRAYIDSVRSESWLTSSENVRLSYFSKLASEVENGKKQQAVNHFLKPKAAIEAWFKNEVDSLSTEVGEKKFIETVDSELEHVIQEIRNQKSCGSIKDFVCRYLTQVEDVDYNPGEDLALGSATDFDLLRAVILKKLAEDKGFCKLDIVMINPSTHSEVRNLLGCTEPLLLVWKLVLGSGRSWRKRRQHQETSCVPPTLGAHWLF